jgi:glycosyltransferase involved in cell wall biosynthesis
MDTVSVLMSTYASELAHNLDQALETIYAQSVVPAQVVLVLDGLVARDQEQVISRFAQDKRVPCLTIVRLSKNGGLAAAMNAGLAHCVGEFTMRMDSDDLSAIDRIELQLDYARHHPDVDVITSWTEEFFDDGSPCQLKVSPIRHDAVVNALRWRNILVHPSLFIRTEMLRRIGGYRGRFGMLEDYDLFVRLAMAGATFHVIPKFLVRMRSSIAQRRRRGGFAYLLNELRFRAEWHRAGFLTTYQFIASIIIYAAFRAVSPWLRCRLYVLARTGRETPTQPPLARVPHNTGAVSQ